MDVEQSQQPDENQRRRSAEAAGHRRAVEQTLQQDDVSRRLAQDQSLRRLQPPAQVPGYETERFLGSGAYGEVWVARDLNTRRRVAIKFYTHRGGLDWSLLSREVEKLSLLFNDRYVVQLIDVGWEADPPYYVMEYLDNGSLADRLNERPLPAEEAVEVFREVCTGLIHSHGKGVLHCDLKPHNVLLDQDLKPRLADFGQARMSTDHTPALGTLYYMAPEQADLKAVPDARWDVYGLGALLYCMLTGEPPYRRDEAHTMAAKGSGIEEQLRHYRQLIEAAPRPTKHRKMPGVDRDLAEIVDRCLAAKPEKRFANPQAVADALKLRDMRKARRPLLVLGALGPALLLTVMTIFGVRGATQAVRESEQFLLDQAVDNDRFAARFVADSVAGDIDRRWYILEKEADDEELRMLLESARKRAFAAPESAPLVDALDRKIRAIRDSHQDIKRVRNWFLLDDRGVQWARSEPPKPGESDTLGKPYPHRDYFHALGSAYQPGVPVKPIDEPHLSQVYTSARDQKTRVVAFSVPVWNHDKPPPEAGNSDAARQVIGVLALSVEVGDFVNLRPDKSNKHNLVGVLVDLRDDERTDDQGQIVRRKGSVLEHPWSDAAQRDRLSEMYVEPALVNHLLELRTMMAPGATEVSDEIVAKIATMSVNDAYEDKLGDEFAGRWLAAYRPVVVAGRKPEIGDTGWMVIVQERYSDAVGPATDLGNDLVRHGLIALGVVLAVVTALWGFVMIVFNESPRFRFSRVLRRKAGLPTTSLAGGGSTGTGTASSVSPVPLRRTSDKTMRG